MSSKDWPQVIEAELYATQVIAEIIPACHWVKLACQRHFDDIDRAEYDDEFHYRFDKRKASKPINFIQKLHHVKGRWAGKKDATIDLMPWQKFAIASIFGWVHVDTGIRRFTDVFMLIPRKNGKSIIGAAIGLYCFVADGEYGSEIYSGAQSEAQSWEVFRPARLMAERHPQLKEHFGIEVHAKKMFCPGDGSRFEPLIGNPGDGASASLAIVDEYHEADTPDLFDTMKTGMGARENPLMLVITTAGSNTSGPCRELQMDIEKVLARTLDDDRHFGLIYTIDEGDDWTTEASLRKANPNYDVSVSGEYLKGQIHRAKNSPSKQNVTITKHLNRWVGAKEAWLNMELWASCADETLMRDDFTDYPSVIGIDLATRIDLAATCQVFYKTMDDGRLHYYAFTDAWLPDEALANSKNAHRFGDWANRGYIHIMDGAEIDLNEIQHYLIGEDQDDSDGLAHKYIVNEIAYDPWQATQLAQSLADDGATVLEFKHTVGNMSPAMKEVEAAISSGRLHFDGSPVMTWCASNTIAKLDKKDNIYPNKQHSDSKIDCMIALIMAVGRAFAQVDTASKYETQSMTIL
jgi:phage terminase large subunit-like protein